MAPTLRRKNLAQVLIAAACSSASPSTASGPIEGVSVLEQDLSCNGYCPEENVGGAALAQGNVWVTRATDKSPDNGQTHVDDTQLGLVTFGADAGVTILQAAPSFTSNQFGSGESSDVGVTSDGSKVYFAYDDRSASQVAVQDGPDGGIQRLPGQDGVVIGVTAQPQGAVVAVVPSCCGSSCGSTFCLGGNNLDNGGSFGLNPGSANASGSIYGLNSLDGGITPPVAAHFDIQATTHVLTTDGTSLYWIGGGKLWTMPADLSAPPASSNAVTGNVVGLSAYGGAVAWATLQGTSVCNNGPCIYTPQSYAIWTTTGKIYETTSATQFCLGLAIDATSAYFAIAEQRTTTNCCNNQDGGLNYNTDVYTTGIARISLTGVASQTPSVIPFSTDRMYGPRRFLVDGTYLYGIDPAYVLRIAKTAFP